MIRESRIILIACLSLLPSCDGGSSQASGCESNADCEEQQLCIDSVCRDVCNHDCDCPSPTEKCDDGVCQETSANECTDAGDCTNPPDCRVTEGAACCGGRCHYQPGHDGEDCDDHSDCTLNDTCNDSGQCVGDILVCDDPPGDECVGDDDTFRVYISPGSCNPTTGDCSYAHEDRACPDCEAACLTPCMGVVCDDDFGGCVLSTGICVPGTPSTCDYSTAATADDLTPCFLDGETDLQRGVCYEGICEECTLTEHCVYPPAPGVIACFTAQCSSMECSYVMLGDSWECEPATCADGVAYGVRVCTADGSCPEGSSSPCTPYVCDGQACRSDCSDNDHCATGYTCTDTVCGADLPGVGETCTGTCAAGLQCDNDVCCVDSAAHCCDEAADCPDHMGCDAGTGRPHTCYETCTDYTDDLCASTDYYCSSNVCVSKLVPGTGCTNGGQCDTGYCVDDVCCNDECAGTCRACDLTGSVGTCSDVPRPTITSANDAARCGSGTVDLSATASSGATIRWYSAETGGSPLATGTSFTTPSLSSTTTYWLEAVLGDCVATSRTSITATINSRPSTPGAPTPWANPSCGPTTLAAMGSGLYWQGTNSSGTSTSQPATSAYSVTDSGTYYVRAYDGTCWSSGSGSATVLITTSGCALGSPCTSDSNCTSGNCECADPSCTSRVCNSAACVCRYAAANGSGCTGGDLGSGTDPDDVCGGTSCCGYCSGGACAYVSDGSTCDSGAAGSLSCNATFPGDHYRCNGSAMQCTRPVGTPFSVLLSDFDDTSCFDICAAQGPTGAECTSGGSCPGANRYITCQSGSTSLPCAAEVSCEVFCGGVVCTGSSCCCAYYVYP